MRKNKIKVLFLYNGTELYTPCVYEHINSFAKYSNHKIHFLHHDKDSSDDINFKIFDCIGIHYTIRMPFHENYISTLYEEKIKNFNKLKFLFIQDEYENLLLTKKKIKELKINLVFTVIPEGKTEAIYSKKEFPNTKFINVLTGYVPDQKLDIEIKAPSLRPIFCGYRGRKLSVKYGELGFDKVRIAKIVKSYCQKKNLSCDIEIDEKKRIYHQDWLKFLSQCRSVLGTESGSNIFDFNGNLDLIIQNFTYMNPNASSDDIYKKLLEPLEIKNFMNQISPRIFEAIKYRCALVLFEGNYSGIIKPEKHYISLKKDGSNIEDVFRLLQDDSYVNSMTDQAYKDIIDTQNLSYYNFVKKIDSVIEQNFEDLKIPINSHLTTSETIELQFNNKAEFISGKSNIKFFNIKIPIEKLNQNNFLKKIWNLIPLKIKRYIKKNFFVL